MSTELTTTEAARLTELEAIIDRGKETVEEVRRALTEIHKEKLYKVTHKTFDSYVQERWGFKRAYAYRLIEADGIAGGNVYKVDKTTEAVISHTIPLKALPEAERDAAWDEAVKTAPKDKAGKPKVTAKHVEKVVAKRKEPAPDPAPAPVRNDKPAVNLNVPAPKGEPFDAYNARLLDLADMVRDLRTAFLDLADDRSEANVYAAWMDGKGWRNYFDNLITEIQMHRVVKLLPPSVAKHMPDGGRCFAYERDLPKLKKIEKGAAA